MSAKKPMKPPPESKLPPQKEQSPLKSPAKTNPKATEKGVQDHERSVTESPEPLMPPVTNPKIEEIPEKPPNPLIELFKDVRKCKKRLTHIYNYENSQKIPLPIQNVFSILA